MNPLDRMEANMNDNRIMDWKGDATQLKNDINRLYNSYNSILDRYADERDAAVDNDSKEKIDNIFIELTEAKNKFCALSGGRRTHRTHRGSHTRHSKLTKSSRKQRR
jgi:hypothetical protein